ncbi:MAG: phosphotransferase family protein [Solirubrobacteraceae bacterium]
MSSRPRNGAGEDSDEAGRLPGLELARAQRWLEPRLELGELPLQAELISGGRSNLTYWLRAGDREWILRRPPLGRLLPSAHSMAREYLVLERLANSAVPTPRVLGICEDEQVIGAPFYVMELIRGRILRAPEEVDLTPAQGRACGSALVRTLARLHLLDYERLGLGELGRPDGYTERQVRRWHRQLQAGRARELPLLDELGRRLAEAIPPAHHSSLLHGDYRIDNVVLDPEHAGSVRAVLDWEMSTIGDPLADLGMLMMYWREGDEAFPSAVHEIPARAGFPTRNQAIELYARETGWSVEHLDFHIAFAHFKLAAIVEGIHARHLEGLTVGEGFEQISSIAPALAEQGLEALR